MRLLKRVLVVLALAGFLVASVAAQEKLTTPLIDHFSFVPNECDLSSSDHAPKYVVRCNYG